MVSQVFKRRTTNTPVVWPERSIVKKIFGRFLTPLGVYFWWKVAQNRARLWAIFLEWHHFLWLWTVCDLNMGDFLHKLPAWSHCLPMPATVLMTVNSLDVIAVPQWLVHIWQASFDKLSNWNTMDVLTRRPDFKQPDFHFRWSVENFFLYLSLQHFFCHFLLI